MNIRRKVAMKKVPSINKVVSNAVLGWFVSSDGNSASDALLSDVLSAPNDEFIASRDELRPPSDEFIPTSDEFKPFSSDSNTPGA